MNFITYYEIVISLQSNHKKQKKVFFPSKSFIHVDLTIRELRNNETPRCLLSVISDVFVQLIFHLPAAESVGEWSS